MIAPSFDTLPDSFTTLTTDFASVSSAGFNAGKSRLGLCLRRGAAAGLRIVIIAPRETRDAEGSAKRFPERRIKPDAHVYWETGRRVLLGRSTLPHDRGSWHVLVADRDGRVVGTISARFFRGEPAKECIHLLALADASGPIFREQCELALQETREASGGNSRWFGEISDWAVSPGMRPRLVMAMLVRGVAALAATFESPLCVAAANHFRHEVSGLMRRGAAPLGRIGKFGLPPLVDHRTSSWVRIVLLDAGTFHALSGSEPVIEAALLRRRVTIVSIS